MNERRSKRSQAAFSSGDLYQEYKQVLNQLRLEVGGEVLRQSPSHANVIGEQIIDEALGN